ncbi:MAG TPA: hypothetical protein DCG33_07345 [Prevotellaceae bacterium]|nr:hypothetical protein [Prevotellaceae bacterium]
MRTYKFILQLCIATSLIYFFVSCSGTTSSQSEEEPFWEGQVQPGVYTGSWRYSIDVGTYNKVECTLTIYDDETVKYKEKTQILWGDYNTDIEVSTGYIYKRVETYDGERKVWYSIETRPEPGSRYRHNVELSTSLEFSGGGNRTYQGFNARRGEYGKLKKVK